MDKKKLAVSVVLCSTAGAAFYLLKKQKEKKTEKTPAVPHRQGFYEKYIKRPQDFCCALAALIVLSPVMLITAILVRLRLGSPVIFTQERPGLNGEIFRLYKFRSMTDAKDKDGNPLPDEDRLTDFGKKLRSTSLDELPELFNILKGDMAVVGPRPLLTAYLPYYTEKEMHRHDVRPGLTGWAQIHGRDAVDWEDKFRMDLYYIHHISFWLDVKIIFQTVGKVLKHSDILDGADIQVARLDDIRSEKKK